MRFRCGYLGFFVFIACAANPASSRAQAVLAEPQTKPAATAPATSASAGRPEVLPIYLARLAERPREIPAITAAAEAVAKRWVDQGSMLIHAPSVGESESFAAELSSRAGGLANVRSDYDASFTGHKTDVVLFAPRSWEKSADYLRAEIPKCHDAGLLVVVFGSRRGAPDGLPYDFLIDNGAAGGGADEGVVNQIVNVTDGWLFCGELTAALTRLGHRPGILRGMTLPGATPINREFQDKPAALYPADRAIPAGELAAAYLRELTAVLRDLETPQRRGQIARAADLAAETLRAGHAVWGASFTHVLYADIAADNRSPIRTLNGVSVGKQGRAFTDNLKEGDLLFWFGEWTLNLPWRDYLALIRQTPVRLVPSYRPIREPMEPMEHDGVFYDQKLDDAAMVLEQAWPLDNAVVEIPFTPGKMAPVSGVYVSLLYRMLDEAIAERVSHR